MGYKIFTLCFRQVLNNWKMAIRLSWFWILAFFLFAMVTIFVAFTLDDGMLTRELMQGGSGAFLTVVILGIFAFLMVGMTSVAIGWHRFVLREEIPHSFYVLRREWPLGRYIWSSFKIVFVMFLVIFALMFVLTLILGLSKMGSIPMGPMSIGQMRASGASLMIMLVPFVTIIISTWIFLRLGVALPAVAVGENSSIRVSFRLTKTISGPLFITASLMVLFQFIPAIVQFLIEMVVGPETFLTTLAMPVVSLVFAWFSFFIGFGVLTVVYGHLVENRSI